MKVSLANLIREGCKDTEQTTDAWYEYDRTTEWVIAACALGAAQIGRLRMEGLYDGWKSGDVMIDSSAMYISPAGVEKLSYLNIEDQHVPDDYRYPSRSDDSLDLVIVTLNDDMGWTRE